MTDRRWGIGIFVGLCVALHPLPGHAQMPPTYCDPQFTYVSYGVLSVRNMGNGTAVGITVTYTRNVYGGSVIGGGSGGVTTRTDVVQTIPRLMSGETVLLPGNWGAGTYGRAVIYQACQPQ